jgi:hypothetical protein
MGNHQWRRDFYGASYQSSSGNPIYTPEFLAGDIFTAEAGFRIGL